jgi:hypothetical protein
MNDDYSVWRTISEFGIATAMLAIVFLLLFAMGCTTAPVVAPPRVLMVPHVCQPMVDSAAFQKCAADCPEGKAFVVENANDTACYCKKPKDPT